VIIVGMKGGGEYVRPGELDTDGSIYVNGGVLAVNEGNIYVVGCEGEMIVVLGQSSKTLYL